MSWPFDTLTQYSHKFPTYYCKILIQQLIHKISYGLSNLSNWICGRPNFVNPVTIYVVCIN